MKVFITGIAGFLGSHIADRFLADGCEVVGIDNLIGGSLSNVPQDAHFYEVDCCDFDRVKELMANVDVVYHCAATAYEGLSVFSPALVTRNIVLASTTVFSAAISAGVRRIVHCSSMARYGAGITPFREDLLCLPQDPYGIGKLCAEQMLANLCKVHDTEYVIAVPHNIIGSRQKYDDPFRNVAAIMINLMLDRRSPAIYGNGEQQRCFSFVQDCVNSLYMMAFQHNVVGEVINIGPDEEPVTINELYKTIANLTGFNGLPRYMPGRPQEVKVALCSSDKARELLSYQTTTSLKDGLGEMVKYIKTHGVRRFVYHLPLEIISEKTPRTWTDKLF